MPRVTVAMSVHNAIKPAYASMAIDSILNQTFHDLELRIVSDGPLAEPLSRVLQDSAHRDSRVLLSASAKCQGLAVSMNRIIEETDSAYFARMDADDISLPLRIEEQVEHLEANLSLDLTGTFAREIDECGKILFDKCMPVDSADILKFMPYRNPFIHPSVVFRRRFFTQAGLYPTDLPGMEDTGLWIRALTQGVQASNVPKYLYLFRIDAQFWQRRRGLARAFRETWLRVGSIRSLHLPWYKYLMAPSYFAFRLSPPPVVKYIYFKFR